MNSVKSKTTLVLFVGLVLTVSYPTLVNAVTDAELEALEKQIEELEEDEKKQAAAEKQKKAEAEAETKIKAEQKRQIEAEMERKRLAELEKQRIEEEQRLAKESKEREEEDKKKKSTMLITEAEQAVTNKDKELAISKYSEALFLSPGDSVANSGIKEAEKLMEKICYQFVGTWVVKMFVGEGMIQIMEDGMLYYGNTKESPVSWVCYPEKNQIEDSKYNMFYTLIESGTCLTGPGTGIGGDSCYRRVD